MKKYSFIVLIENFYHLFIFSMVRLLLQKHENCVSQIYCSKNNTVIIIISLKEKGERDFEGTVCYLFSVGSTGGDTREGCSQFADNKTDMDW